MASRETEDRPSRITVGIADAAVSTLFMALGLLVIVDSRRVGIGWADDGPQSGYFPFYIGLMLCLAGGTILLRTVTGWVRYRAHFATVEQLRNVRSVFMPTCVYVAAIYLLGIYVASALYIGWFMRVHGRFSWAKLLPAAAGVPLALFFLFDKWFLVPLPKGPLERLLGY